MIVITYPFLNGRALPAGDFSWLAAAVTAVVLVALVALAWRALRSEGRKEKADIPPADLGRAA